MLIAAFTKTEAPEEAGGGRRPSVSRSAENGRADKAPPRSADRSRSREDEDAGPKAAFDGHLRERQVEAPAAPRATEPSVTAAPIDRGLDANSGLTPLLGSRLPTASGLGIADLQARLEGLDGAAPEEVGALLAELGLQQLPDGSIAPLASEAALAAAQQAAHSGATLSSTASEQVTTDTAPASKLAPARPTASEGYGGAKRLGSQAGDSRPEAPAGDLTLATKAASQPRTGTGTAEGATPLPTAATLQAGENSRFGGQADDTSGEGEPSKLTSTPLPIFATAEAGRGESLAQPLAAETPISRSSHMTNASAAGLLTPLSEPAPETALDRSISRQLARSVLQELPDGQRLLTVRLTPPELGTVRVQIIEHAGSLQIRLGAEDDGVRAALERALPGLRQDLRLGDGPVPDVRLTDHFMNFDGQADDGRQAQQDAQRDRNHKQAPFSLEAAATEAPAADAAPRRPRLAEGLLDALA